MCIAKCGTCNRPNTNLLASSTCQQMCTHIILNVRLYMGGGRGNHCKLPVQTEHFSFNTTMKGRTKKKRNLEFVKHDQFLYTGQHAVCFTLFISYVMTSRKD